MVVLQRALNFTTRIRNIYTKYTRYQKTGHYKVLGLEPNATQADIKSAYYKLSMIYHPDKNQDSETAAEKFRTITEAYDVLSNVKARKLYDRGLQVERSTAHTYEDAPLSKFYRSRDIKSRPPAPRQSVEFDFDAWSKAHYGSMLRRESTYRARQEILKQQNRQVEEVKYANRILFLVCLILCSAYIGLESNSDTVINTTMFGGADFVSVQDDK